MKLRNIALSSIIVLGLVVMVAEFAVTHLIVKKGFDDLERSQVAADVRRVKNEFLREVENLDIFLWDWSSWDDTHDFAQDQNTEYVDSNLAIETFVEQALNIIVITAPDGRTLYGRAIGEDEKDSDILLDEFLASIKGADLPRISDGDGTGGLLVMPEGPIIFSTRPILRTGGQGPPVGTMIMAKFLSEEIVKAISQRLELEIVVHSTQGRLLPDKFTTALRELETGQETTLFIKDAETIDGFATLKDINGLPALIIDVTEPRRVSLHGRSVALYNTLFLAVALIAFGALMYMLIQKKVISRMERLNAEVQEIDIAGGPTMHVTVEGEDEISQLAHNVNGMLERITESQTALQEAHNNLEVKVAERTIELEKANEDLLCLDKAKTHFLSSTSHELRTPLTAIHGFVKLMERSFRKHFLPHLSTVEATSQRVDTYLENFKIVRSETERLGRLIDDLLDLNKIEANRIEWRDEDVDVRKLVQGAADAISGQLDETPNVQLVVDIPLTLPTIHADKDRIHQVLINLLNNAAKFTEQGYVKAVVRETEEHFLEFSIEDTGSGIAEVDRDQIFEIFYQSQAERELSGKPFGTGLGLAICKEIVEHYGGRIWVESKIGKGSAFKFIMPYQ